MTAARSEVLESDEPAQYLYDTWSRLTKARQPIGDGTTWAETTMLYDPWGRRRGNAEW
jgi:hypothetical protein